jgi:hypothetical protein
MKPTRFAAALVCAASVLALAVAPAGAAQPGFRPASTSWLTAAHGYVLGYTSCQDGSLCPELRETLDGGARWRAVAPPPIGLPDNHNHVRLTFATDSDGFASDGTQVFATGDAARHWHRLDFEGLRSPRYVYKLTAGFGRVFAVASRWGQRDADATALYSAPLGAGALRPVPGLTVVGGETHGDVAFGGGGLQYAAGADEHADRYWISLDGVRFTTAPAPCPDLSAAELGGVRQGAAVVMCAGSPGSPQPGMSTKRLSSAPGLGRPFAPGGTAPATGIAQGFAAVSPEDAVIAAEGGSEGYLYHTTDGGTRWTTTDLGDRGVGLFDLTMVDARTGFVVDGLPEAEGGSAVYRTTDGGRTWAVLELG